MCVSLQTAVFTPAYGSVTNVRINSCMSTPQVLRVLLNKFKIENSPDDFALYLVHASGGSCEAEAFFKYMCYLSCFSLLSVDVFMLQSVRN